MERVVSCPACGKDVFEGSPSCPHCKVSFEYLAYAERLADSLDREDVSEPVLLRQWRRSVLSNVLGSGAAGIMLVVVSLASSVLGLAFLGLPFLNIVGHMFDMERVPAALVAIPTLSAGVAAFAILAPVFFRLDQVIRRR